MWGGSGLFAQLRRRMQPCKKLPRVKKGLLLGIAVLLLVDVLWVGSAGLTRVSELS